MSEQLPSEDWDTDTKRAFYSKPEELYVGTQAPVSKDNLLDEARQFIEDRQAGHSLVKQLAEEVARYENSRVILTQMVETLTAERDQYKQMAEINANTIKCMQAAVNLHSNRIDEIFGAKSS